MVRSLVSDLMPLTSKKNFIQTLLHFPVPGSERLVTSMR